MKQRLISIPFFLLRTTTAGAALLTGLLQTYVFAHILTPQRFSIFILVAAFGYSLWLIDFGIVKILFVRLRARFLAGERGGAIAGHATAVVLFYFLLVAGGALLCFVFMATRTSASPREAAEFALFFLFVALNLVWFALRNISIAVDEYVLFEALETVRRAGYFIGLGLVLFGLAAHRHAARAQRTVGGRGNGKRQAHDRAWRLAAAHRADFLKTWSRFSAPTRPSSFAAAPMRRAKFMPAITPI